MRLCGRRLDISALTIEYPWDDGSENIEAYATELLRLADECRCIVNGHFAGLPLEARPYDTPSEIIERWQQAIVGSSPTSPRMDQAYLPW